MTFLPYRELGRTGFRASRLGIGDLADRAVPLERCVATLRRALDQGLKLVGARDRGQGRDLVEPEVIQRPKPNQLPTW
jgi:hypothetical protein